MLTTSRPFPEGLEPRALRFVLDKRHAKAEPEQMTFDGFPVYPEDPLRESHLLLDAYLREAGSGANDTKPLKLPARTRLLDLPPDARAALGRVIIARVLLYWMECAKPTKVGERLTMYQIEDDGSRQAIRPLCVAMRRRGEWQMPEAGLLEWIEALLIGGQAGSSIDDVLSVDDLLAAAKLHVAKEGMSPTLLAALSDFKRRRDNPYAYGRTEQQRQAALDDLLGGASPASRLPVEANEPWADAVLKMLADHSQAAWAELLAHAATGDGSKPSGKWLKGAKKHVDAVGAREFTRCVSEWLMLAIKPRTKPLTKDQLGTPWHLEFDIYSDKNSAVLKGLAWACAASGAAALAAPLGALAESSYKKIPNLGPRSPKVGNACLVALIELPGQEPRAELSRLKAKVKQPTARKMIEKAIGVSAAAAGMTPDDLEELAVGMYGLTEVGRGEQTVGAYTLQLKIDGTTKVEFTFTDAKGKSRTSVPADLKASHADAVKQFQQHAKDLAKMLPALRDRLERMPMNRRELPMPAWRERYLDHPVVGTLARRLIWSIDAGANGTVAAFYLKGKLVDTTGKAIPNFDDEAKALVRLWHPVGSSPADVLAWREFLQKHEVTQPFKQAHREVYLLTDAERQTQTYSNRFAAHLLRQHQFAALCTQRGWAYRVIGGWDGGSSMTPTLQLPKWKLRAEYWVSVGGDEVGGSGVAVYVSTDQVRFYETSETQPMPIDRVSPLALSEVMRDVDLFVGVASVGNDPAWQPGGNRFGDYWQKYSFGELGASAETRRQVLETLLPRLTKLNDRWRLADRFLVIRGDLRTYKIHLGSGNILMEPNDQYLCIVPARGGSISGAGGEPQVFLPFEGDSTLSVILSKAFLLANDTKIADPTITQQIGKA